MNPPKAEAFAPAKVNLFLAVTGRRADGYHLLDSLAVFPNVADRISGRLAPALSLNISGPFGAGLPDTSDNLVLRAARLLAGSAGADLYLEKNLPVASGIGGGSADAAAALRLLARLWNVKTHLPGLALQLGADVPICLASAPARMGGIGEVLRPSPALPPFGLLLVNPGVAVSTAAIFEARTGAFSPPAMLPPSWRTAAEMAAALRALKNDLQAPACQVAPVIADVLGMLGALPGALLARMSGSGATCFAIFATPQAAARAAGSLNRPGWWRWGGGLYEPASADI